MADILTFKPREERHLNGKAVCIDCKHEWVAVIAAQAYADCDGWLECPKCSCVKGRMKYPFAIGESTWQCGCGNDLFHITPEFTYCPNCGQEQVFS